MWVFVLLRWCWVLSAFGSCLLCCMLCGTAVHVHLVVRGPSRHAMQRVMCANQTLMLPHSNVVVSNPHHCCRPLFSPLPPPSPSSRSGFRSQRHGHRSVRSVPDVYATGGWGNGRGQKGWRRRRHGRHALPLRMTRDRTLSLDVVPVLVGVCAQTRRRWPHGSACEGGAG